MRVVALVTCALLLSNCSSYETTYFVRNAEGEYTPATVSGVPIVVTVPQKLGFLATESQYMVETPVVRDGQVASVARTYTTETTIDRNVISLGASQLVTLDIKRPFFGTAETGIELENQYPTKLSSKVDDKTLDRVLSTAEKLFVQKQGAAISANATKTLIRTRTFMIVYDPVTQKLTRTVL